MTTSLAKVSAAEANRQFSKLLGRVKAGESVVITSRGEPVAKLVPVDPTDEAEALRRERAKQLWHRIETQPPIRVKPWTRDELYEDVL